MNISTFTNSLNEYEWFRNTAMDPFGRLVVYVDKMDLGFIRSVPDKIDGTQILFHYATSLFCNKENYLNRLDDFPCSKKLDKKLTGLGTICGLNVLEDIFYEIHDGEDAVTEYSFQYPHVFAAMQELYNEYGFDVIYEWLDAS